MRERELKRVIPAEADLPGLDDAIPGVDLGPPEQQRVEDRYLDTADLRLARWGVTLRFRKGTGWTLKLPHPELGGGGLDRDELVFSGKTSAPPARVVALVSSLARSESLLPVALLSKERTARRWNLPDGSLVAELVDDEVTASVLVHGTDGGGVEAGFREIEVELAPGADPGLLDLVAERLPLDPDEAAVPKLVRVLGPAAMAPPDVVVPSLPADPTAADVIRAAIGSSVERLLLQLPQVHLDQDPEGVHQSRVALRRLRSDLRTFGALLDPGPVEALRDELSWLGGELGRVRDADVLGQQLRRRLAAHPEIDAGAAADVLRVLDRERKSALAAVTGDLVGPRCLALLEALVALAAEPPLRAEAEGPATTVLPPLVDKSWRKLRRHVRQLDDPPADEALHRTRILAKRVRYAAEAVRPAAPKQAAYFARHAAAIQTVLGDQHDFVVAGQWLEAHAPVLRAPRPSPPVVWPRPSPTTPWRRPTTGTAITSG
ncbi:MAG: CYTH and CHAD domain-containing protein [Acidimicrobiales bacterium]